MMRVLALKPGEQEKPANPHMAGFLHAWGRVNTWFTDNPVKAGRGSYTFQPCNGRTCPPLPRDN